MLPAWGGSSAALAADLPILQQAYERLHPGLYRYQTPDEFRSRIVGLAEALKGSTDLPSQYLALSRLAASVRCGHSYANFFNQTKAVSAQLFEGRDKLPFLFVWIDGRMIVTDNPLGVGDLRPGCEILTIDEVPVGEIQAKLLPYIRADGANDAKRRKLLDVQGDEKFETFDVFFSLLYRRTDPRFRLSVRRQPDAAQSDSLIVEAIDLAQRRALKANSADDETPDYWRLDFPRQNIARIVMPGWALYGAKWDWQARIDEMFSTIQARQARGLVIDLRDNEGGLDCGNELIARLIGSELPLFADYERRVRFRSAPEDLRPYLDTWDRSFDHLGEDATDLGDGFYRLANEGELRAIQPKGPRFAGKVAVLCGPQNSSATFSFLDLMQKRRLGRLYGQPTGGNQRGINGGAFYFLRLPASGLEVDLPLIGTFPKTPRPDAGLTPDVEIAPTVEDIASSHDPVLARAMLDLG
jgi:hypothetical protein